MQQASARWALCGEGKRPQTHSKSEDGEGWGHKRGGFDKHPDSWIKGFFQAFFKHFPGIFRAFFMEVAPWKCLKISWFKNQGIFQGFSGIFQVEKGIFKSPLLCPPLCHPPSKEQYPLSRDTFSAIPAIPQQGAKPPFGAFFTQTYQCDTPFCNISRNTCAIPPGKQARNIFAILSLKVSRDMKVSLLGLLEGWKDPHPQDFWLTKKTARFTKGQFRPY